jgi:hypothetical protein
MLSNDLLSGSAYRRNGDLKAYLGEVESARGKPGPYPLVPLRGEGGER